MSNFDFQVKFEGWHSYYINLLGKNDTKSTFIEKYLKNKDVFRLQQVIFDVFKFFKKN